MRNLHELFITSSTAGYIQEPTFDPKVRLNLRMPEYVRLLSTFEKAPYTPDIADSMNRGEQGTDFAYTSPFSVSCFPI